MKKLIQQNIPHDSALTHVTGRSIFIDDRPWQKDELCVDYVASPVACGVLQSLDATQALQIEGVVAVYTHHDLQHKLWGPIFQDEPLLVESQISYVGQPIAVIAAKSHMALAQAKKLIALQIQELPAQLSITAAKDKNDFIGPIRHIRRGDASTAMQNAKHVLSGELQTGGQEQFYLESQAAIAYPLESGKIEIHSSTQHPTEVQHVVAEALGLPFHHVNCVVKRMGGGFGGKETQAAPFAVMAALVAQKTGCAARIVISKDDDMRTTGKRHPFATQYRVGFDDLGLIQALEVELYSDGGAFADLSTSIMERAMLHMDNAYHLPNVSIQGAVCRTNFHSHTAFRGFGGPQGVAVIENILEDIAQALKLDAYDVRRRNCYDENRNVTPYGQVVTQNHLPQILDQLVVSADYKKRRDEILAFNQTSKTHRRGIALTPVKFGISFTTRFLNQGSALVNVHTDGTIQVSTGATEMGQGVNTKIAQVVAAEFGVPVSFVFVAPTSTEKNANTSPTAASSGADINCAAAQVASGKVLKRLRLAATAYFLQKSQEEDLETVVEDPEIIFADGWVWHAAQPQHKITFAELVKQAYLWRLALQDYGYFKTPTIHFDKELGQGHPFLYYTQGAAVSEVSIDRFTGDVKVGRVDILMDLGQSINPGIDKGQITGAFVQGMGWVTTEKLVYDAKGVLLSHSPTTYKIPNIQDTPRIFNVALLENSINPLNVNGSNAVGEPPLLLGVSVWCAIKTAIAGLQPDQIINLQLPATAEEILMAMERTSA